jgi:hypothetical protein
VIKEAVFTGLQNNRQPPMWNCAHRNDTTRMVILRCIGPDNFFLEKVLFPFETCAFDCPPESEVEVWSHGLGGPELVETRDARDLLIEVDEGSEVGPVPMGFAGLVLAPEWEHLPEASPAPPTESSAAPPEITVP